jgi:lysophospholipase L1-like esterase
VIVCPVDGDVANVSSSEKSDLVLRIMPMTSSIDRVVSVANDHITVDDVTDVVEATDLSTKGIITDTVQALDHVTSIDNVAHDSSAETKAYVNVDDATGSDSSAKANANVTLDDATDEVVTTDHAIDCVVTDANQSQVSSSDYPVHDSLAETNANATEDDETDVVATCGYGTNSIVTDRPTVQTTDQNVNTSATVVTEVKDPGNSTNVITTAIATEHDTSSVSCMLMTDIQALMTDMHAQFDRKIGAMTRDLTEQLRLSTDCNSRLTDIIEGMQRKLNRVESKVHEMLKRSCACKCDSLHDCNDRGHAAGPRGVTVDVSVQTVDCDFPPAAQLRFHNEPSGQTVTPTASRDQGQPASAAQSGRSQCVESARGQSPTHPPSSASASPSPATPSPSPSAAHPSHSDVQRPLRLPQGRIKTFLVGDSNLRKINRRRYDSTGQSHIRTVPGLTTDRLTAILSATKPKPDVDTVILHVGGNDLKKNMPSEECNMFESSLRQCIAQAKETFPNAHIALTGIIPRKGFSPNIIKGSNASMRSLCQQANAIFIPVLSHFIRDNSPNFKSLYDTDGIHINERGIAVLVKQMLACQRELTGRENPTFGKTVQTERTDNKKWSDIVRSKKPQRNVNDASPAEPAAQSRPGDEKPAQAKVINYRGQEPAPDAGFSLGQPQSMSFPVACMPDRPNEPVPGLTFSPLPHGPAPLMQSPFRGWGWPPTLHPYFYGLYQQG